MKYMEHCWNDNDKGKWNIQRKTCPITTLSTTNPTRTDLGSNLGLHGKRPVSNCSSHGTLFQLHTNIHTFTIICTSGTRSYGDTLPTCDQRTDWTLQLSGLTLVGTKRARLTRSRLLMIVRANSTRYCEQNQYWTVLRLHCWTEQIWCDGVGRVQWNG
jgi:hypothetical protein